MKKTAVIFTLFFILFSLASQAQGKVYTKTGKISFFSSTPMENI
jgi:hypothetical protein